MLVLLVIKITVKMMVAGQDLLEEGGEIPLVPREWEAPLTPHWITQVVGALLLLRGGPGKVSPLPELKD